MRGSLCSSSDLVFSSSLVPSALCSASNRHEREISKNLVNTALI